MNFTEFLHVWLEQQCHNDMIILHTVCYYVFVHFSVYTLYKADVSKCTLCIMWTFLCVHVMNNVNISVCTLGIH